MKRLRDATLLSLTAVAIACVIFRGLLPDLIPTVYAFPQPLPGHTGAPGDSNCTPCHSGSPAGGSVVVTFPSGLTYTPGVTQHLSVTVNDTTHTVWSFQLTARLASNTSTQAGSFTATDTAHTIVQTSGSIQDIETTSGGIGMSTWNLDWTPPSSNVGSLNFYVAGIGAGSPGGPTTGNGIYNASYTLTPATLTPAAPTPPASPTLSNPDCTLIVPKDPLTAKGLATPYQLVATDPNNGPCHETDKNQSAFVQAAIIDPETGKIWIYNPLVIDKDSTPAAAPVVPKLPHEAVVALWFGYNGNNLTLQAEGDELEDNKCVQGLAQFAYCNAPAFFKAAHRAIRNGELHVPPLGFSPKDGQPCPTVRSFAVADQDQSDNLPTTYLKTANGLAQDTAQNMTLPGAKRFGNPSDNRLTNVLLAPALGCTSWEAPDLANPGHTVPALPLNELQARAYQLPPRALIPAGDPFVLNPTFTGQPDLAKLNAYRRGVDQPVVDALEDASTTKYCRHLRKIAPEKLQLDQDIFRLINSPFPDVANSLFTFMAQRFVGTYEMLNCQALLNEPDPVTLIIENGVVTDAMIH